jgi:hypothetical protein
MMSALKYTHLILLIVYIRRVFSFSTCLITSESVLFFLFFDIHVTRIISKISAPVLFVFLKQIDSIIPLVTDDNRSLSTTNAERTSSMNQQSPCKNVDCF